MQDEEKKCEKCGDSYEPDSFRDESNVCVFCERNAAFSQFAASCGLTRYPDPSGERYVNKLDGTCAGKKIECVDFIDELWKALVKARNGDSSLIPG